MFEDGTAAKVDVAHAFPWKSVGQCATKRHLQRHPPVKRGMAIFKGLPMANKKTNKPKAKEDKFTFTRTSRIFDAGGFDLPAFHVSNSRMIEGYFDFIHRGSNPDYWKDDHEYNGVFRVAKVDDPAARQAYAEAMSSAKEAGRISPFIEKLMVGNETGIAEIKVLIRNGLRRVMEVASGEEGWEAAKPIIDELAVMVDATDPTKSKPIKRLSTSFSNYVSKMNLRLSQIDEWDEPKERKDKAKEKRRKTTHQSVVSMLSKSLKGAESSVTADELPKTVERLDNFMTRIRRNNIDTASNRAKSLRECAKMHEAEKKEKKAKLIELEADTRCGTDEFAAIMRFWRENSGPKAKLRGRSRWRKYAEMLVSMLRDPSTAPRCVGGKTADQVEDAIKAAMKSKRPSEELLDEFRFLHGIDELAWQIRDIHRYLERWHPSRFLRPHHTNSPEYAQWTGVNNGIRSVRLYKEPHEVQEKHVLEVRLEGDGGVTPPIKSFLSPDMATNREFIYWVRNTFNRDGSIKGTAKSVEVTVSFKLFFDKKFDGGADLAKPYFLITVRRNTSATINGFRRGDASRPYVRFPLLGLELAVNPDNISSAVVRRVDDDSLFAGRVQQKDRLVAVIVEGSDGKPSRKEIPGESQSAVVALANAIKYVIPGKRLAIVASRDGIESETASVVPDRACALDLNMGSNFIVGEKTGGGLTALVLDTLPRSPLDSGVSFKNRMEFAWGVDHCQHQGHQISHRAYKALVNARKAGARRIAAEAVEFAKNGKFWTLVIEDLTPSQMMDGKNSKGRNRAVANWAVAEITKAIEQACLREAITVVKKPAAYTSMVCPKCCDEWDGSDPDIRMVFRYSYRKSGKDRTPKPVYDKTGKHAICPSCLSETHPDINAGFNLLRKHRGTFPYKMVDRFNRLPQNQKDDFWDNIEGTARKVLKSRMKKCDRKGKPIA